MTLQIELWALLTTLGGWLLIFFGGLFAVAKVIASLVERRLEEKFKAQEETRKLVDAGLQETLRQHLEEERKTTANLASLEKDFLKWQAELPLHYVRRDDFLRTQSVIELKIDKLYLRMENAQLRGGNEHA